MRGAVQGVGFRPFVFRLAAELGLFGTVSNSPQGIFIEVEGSRHLLDEFVGRLESEKPSHAIIQNLELSFLPATGFSQFEILESAHTGEKSALIMPDIATCGDCLSEIIDPQNRRHLYPFTNCTHCGPRFSIIEGLPYDRANTTMKGFGMCPECEGEYYNTCDRRFHAQPIACPRCGPHLELWDYAGKFLASRHGAMLAAARAIRDGQIVAVKGIGGFQLLTDARNQDAVQRLRLRKNREEKPFAVMFPDLNPLSLECEFGAFEDRLLKSPEAPIVLLRKKAGLGKSCIAEGVAPKNPQLGVMLPYSPLHHILMRELNFPVVATSGNVGGEPICLDEHEALLRLNDVADLFLVHNRPIARQLDDSVARIILNREQILRRARGYAPLPIQFKTGPQESRAILAVGAHLKNTVALAAGRQIFLSQHIGDLESEAAMAAFYKTVADFEDLYEAKADVIACDLHPEYPSSKFARANGVESRPIQHHFAHVMACAAENEVASPLLGIAWDGTGLGTDGKIWGGEFLLVSGGSFERVAHFREFSLPGGETAIKEPRRSALGLLWEVHGEELRERDDWMRWDSFSDAELSTLRRMLSRQINSPRTTSAGRLFDAVASLTGLRQRNSFEGQAAMELEFAARRDVSASYLFELSHPAPMVIDWEPMIFGILEDLKSSLSIETIAAKFHNTLVRIIVEIAGAVGEQRVVLCGGCFQNKFLLERSILKLREAGFEPSWPQRVPANDGGIAFGQAVAALQSRKETALPGESELLAPASPAK